jgi:serpin B
VGAFKALDTHLVAPVGDGATLLVANGLWYQEENPAQQAFIETAKVDYDAEVRGVDFKRDPLGVERKINVWVGMKTKGKICDLLPAGSLDERTRIALVNAVYFKGRWEHPFKAGGTAPRPFFLSPGVSVMTPQMSEREMLRSATTPLCDLLELPYRGGRISMVILLPRAREGLPLLEKSLDQAALLEWLAALDFSSPTRIHVTLPRFRMTYAAELNRPLRSLGVIAAFAPGAADFSGIDGRRDLHLSTVLHKAFINVDEEGTEAAAATFAGVATLGVERAEEFRADHPFLFVIRDNASGTLLFLGRVADPRVQ